MERYSVVRRDAIVERIEGAVKTSGAEVLTSADPRPAPLSDRIETGRSQGEALRSAPGRHRLEKLLGLPASDTLDVVMGRIGRE